MSRLTRTTAASRAFGISAILGLSLALLDAAALQATLLLAAVSASAIAADFSEKLASHWIAMVEGALAALLIAVALPAGVLLLPYLVVPTLVAGLVSGFRPAIAVVAAETAGLSALLVIADGNAGLLAGYEVSSPWLLTALGVGLLGAWLRHLGIGPSTAYLDTSYEAARRLLGQLRTVARRLSSGLDTGSMSAQLLGAVHRQIGDSRSALFVRTEGGLLVPMNFRGEAAREALQDHGDLLNRCWAESEPVLELNTQAGQPRNHIALPVRAGSRMLGIVVAESDEAPTPHELAEAMREVNEHALRLDAALLFDEVRSMATIEERHRLAREIHDGIAQEIASLGYVVDDLSATASSPSQLESLQELRSELTRVVSELRLSIFDLRSDVAPSVSLGAALSDYVREVGARSGLTVHLTLDEATTRLRSEVETELLRIAQEAITNARRHSAAKNLWVDCRIRPPFAQITVVDDGNGLGAPRQDSFGLRIMRERAERVDARLTVTDRHSADPKGGTSVTVTVGSTDSPLSDVDVTEVSHG